MKAVNLLPRSQGISGVATDRPKVLIAAAAVAIAAMGIWAVAANQSADDAAAQLRTAQVQKVVLDQQVAALGVYSQRAQTLAAQQLVVNQLAAGRTDWERLVRDVVTVLPTGVSVNTINATLPTSSSGAPGSSSSGSPGQPNTTAPQGMHIVGDAFTQTEVAVTMARLATIPGLGTPRLAQSQVSNTGGKNVVAFTIDIPINPQALDVDATTGLPSSAATTATPTAGTGGTP
jgi:Tfp pilus assembly protein PilN